MSKEAIGECSERDGTAGGAGLANASVAVLAGNSRLQLLGDGSILVEAQIKAFEAALAFAARIRDGGSATPRISLAFDHQGVFRLQFLLSGLTNSQKRNPRLVHLKPEIVDVYSAVAAKYGVALEEIRVIHEDSARQHAAHVLSAESLPEAIVRRMVSPGTGRANSVGRLTCAVITKEYFEKAARECQGPSTLLEVFFEDSPWSRDLAYVRGLQLSHLLGVESAIRLNLVGLDGEVAKGQIIGAMAVA